MRERPILFSGAMVRAILDGRKFQTRRVVKRRPRIVDVDLNFRVNTWGFWGGECSDNGEVTRCPYGNVGDRLWVRETWSVSRQWDYFSPSQLGQMKSRPGVHYLADGEKPNCAPGCSENHGKTRVSIHMPRWASRTTLEVVRVGIDRLRDITEEDARAEGIATLATDKGPLHPVPGSHPEIAFGDPREAFAALWKAINGADSWAANPWVWVVEFKRVTP